MSVQYPFTSHFCITLVNRGISIFLIFDPKHIYCGFSFNVLSINEIVKYQAETIPIMRFFLVSSKHVQMRPVFSQVARFPKPKMLTKMPKQK